MGGEIVGEYAVLGPYDSVNVVEAPDNTTTARISMESGERCRLNSDMTNDTRDPQGPKDVFDTIRTLLAVRSYQSTPVPEAVIRRIVEAGRLTGSGMNGQPWHFIVVRDAETLRRLGALASSGPYVARAPLAIVVATDRTRFAVSDASRAIQSMMLAAWAAGVGSNWVGFGGLEQVKPVLDIPATLDVLALLPFGYPARAIGRGKKQRKPLREVAHLERYGRPFE